MPNTVEIPKQGDSNYPTPEQMAKCTVVGEGFCGKIQGDKALRGCNYLDQLSLQQTDQTPRRLAEAAGNYHKQAAAAGAPCAEALRIIHEGQ